MLCSCCCCSSSFFIFPLNARHSLWRRFSSKTSEWVSLLISRKPFDPFPDGNLSSLPCLMWCYALPRWLNGTSIQKFSTRHWHRRSFATRKYLKKQTKHVVHFHWWIWIFSHFVFENETGKTQIIFRMLERPPASFSTRYIGLYWMRRKSAPMRIVKPALRRGSHFPTSSHLRASRFSICFCFLFLSSLFFLCVSLFLHF